MNPPDLQAAITRAEELMRAHMKRTMSQAGIFSLGASDIHPANLAFWVSTVTDAERDALLGNPNFEPNMRSILFDAGYPGDAVPLVGFTAESEETMQRDRDGNWWYR